MSPDGPIETPSQDRNTECTAEPRKDWPFRTPFFPPEFLFALATALFLFTNLFILPSTPVSMGPDQGIYLLNAVRMLHGQQIYRDFFDFVTPGVTVLYYSLFEVFGPRAWVPNVLLMLIGTALTLLTLLVSKKVLQRWAAYLPPLLFVAFAMRNTMDGTHHWYSSLFVMAGILAVIEKRTLRRLFLAGCLFGISSFFTQTRGAFAAIGLGAFLIWEARRDNRSLREFVESEFALAIASASTVAASLAFFAYKVGIGALTEAIIVFPVRYYPADPPNTFRIYWALHPPLSSLSQVPIFAAWLFILALIPFVYPVSLIHLWRTASGLHEERLRRLVLLNFMGIFIFLSIASAPGWTRLTAVSMPGLILATCLVSGAGTLSELASRGLMVAALAYAILAPLKVQRSHMYYQDLPVGRLAWSHQNEYEEAIWLQERTRPGDFFFSGGSRFLYFPLSLQDPAKVPFVVANGYTRPADVEDVVHGLQRHPARFVLWQTFLNYMGRPDDNLVPLREYLRREYHVVTTFGGLSGADQMWERNKLDQ